MAFAKYIANRSRTRNGHLSIRVAGSRLFLSAAAQSAMAAGFVEVFTDGPVVGLKALANDAPGSYRITRSDRGTCSFCATSLIRDMSINHKTTFDLTYDTDSELFIFDTLKPLIG